MVIGEPFARRYHIMRLLGVGGMGAVYQAWDEELAVVVAVKVIRPEAVRDLETTRALERRFKQELVLARQVTHENVVRIHDLGEVNGVKYITMPYVEGEDLATILKREGVLSVPRVMKFARTMISGLAAAHAAGVIHRDLKPANLMIDSTGAAMIMDFGIARSSLGPGTGGATQTVQGAIIGTVEYMAPEQAKGETVDQRADLYAFGLILYDALLGRRRAEGAESAIAELTSRMLTPPPAPRVLNPAIPPALDRIVAQCLQPNPANRYQTAREVAAALAALDDDGRPLRVARRVTPRLVGAVVALVVALLAMTWWGAGGRVTAPPEERKPISVLVADFDNQTGDSVFDGVVEQGLAIGLEGASFVSIYPRTSALQIVDRLNLDGKLGEESARLVSRREGVSIVVAGSVASRDGRYVIAARALDPALEPGAKDELAAVEVTAADKAGVLAAVASVGSQLRQALGDTQPVSAHLADAETFTASSLEAMSAYTRAQSLSHAGRQREALEEYERAVRLDPNLARAYSGIGVIYGTLRQDDKAKAAYEKALQLIERMSEREKYRTLGGYYLLVTYNFELAVTNYRELVRLYPADHAGHANLAYAYVMLRNIPAAVEHGRKAIEIYPNNHPQRVNYAMYSMYAGDFSTALDQANIILKDHPQYELAHLTAANTHAAAGDLGAARAAFATLKGLGAAGASMAALGEADLALHAGRAHDAIALLEAGLKADLASENSGQAAAKYVALAEALHATGDREGARKAARQAGTLRQHESVLFPAALLLIDGGDSAAPLEFARLLDTRLQTQTASYADLIRGQIALKERRVPDAVEAFRQAQKRYDSWWSHVLLGRAYLEVSRFAEAIAEFEQALKKKGEAVDVFFENTSTSRYLPPVYYWLGRAQEGLRAASAANNSFRLFLAIRANAQPPDPLAADAQQRISTQ